MGSIVMAIGIFALYALQKTIFFSIEIARLITFELFILWMYMSVFILFLYLHKRIFLCTRCINSKFGIGTWVAGTAVLAMLLLKIFPSSHIVALMLSVLASGIWVVYLRLIFRNILSNGFNSIRVPTGIILLPTVSAQSIALLMNSFFIGQVTPYVNQSLLILGYLFYVIGFIVIIKYYFTIKLKRLLLSWSNTNSILHGAL